MATKTKKKKSGKKKYSKKQKQEIIDDYKLGVLSREASYLGRRETLTGKAKFGIFGDGKEIPQVVLAKYFKEGDFRSGYYRGQTFMFAIGQVSVQEFFAQLYAHANDEADPHTHGRQMNAHFSTRTIDENGEWLDLTKQKNTSADISPTSGQMARLLGLAQASNIYRNEKAIKDYKDAEKFSDNGNEIAWGMIGDASTSEGPFWETVNAAGVLQVPMVLSIWDDGYGISVPREHQTTKGSISEALAGFQRTNDEKGWEILTVKAWDYSALKETYAKAERIAREEHVPVLVHVQEVTQPQGHSTSGSHERYKSDERLQWEEDFCCLAKMREWMLKEKISDEETLDEIESEAKKEVKKAQKAAWKAFSDEMNGELKTVEGLLNNLAEKSDKGDEIKKLIKQMKMPMQPIRRNIISAAKKAMRITRGEDADVQKELMQWLEQSKEENAKRYHSHLYSETKYSPLLVDEVHPEYDDDAKSMDGRMVLRDNFDAIFAKYSETLIFGEDTGYLGDVNKGVEGMQEKYGDVRVRDTGIREATILGQGIGMAMRGLRPIAEIQYLDYLLFCFQGMSDDLATVRYRSAGSQKAPVIVRTRGHRLEGIWHTGSPMGMILNGIRGIHICVPRNLTDAAGMYNTLLQGDDPALVIEPLNAYRLKEKMPSNLGEFTVPLGIPSVVSEGEDITIVSYGSTCNICEAALSQLDEAGISAELIDIRTLLPFDREQMIVESLKKTNRILFVDEDVPGGATAFMMNKVLQDQQGYFYLDSEPQCLTAKAHRSPYGSDGDYFTKPNEEDIFDAIYEIMRESDPEKYAAIY